MPRRLAVLVVLLLSTTLLHASQESGIIITFGAFQIAVLYDDVVESPPSIWIRDPQYVLLDLLRFLKANENALFSRRAMIDVDLYEDRLTISESYYRKGILSGKTILEKHVTGNFSSDITDVLCDQLRRSDGECFPAGPEVKVRLYRCCGEEGSCGIEFGAIPSDSINDRYSLEPPWTAHPRGKVTYVTVTEKNIHRYFETQSE